MLGPEAPGVPLLSAAHVLPTERGQRAGAGAEPARVCLPTMPSRHLLHPWHLLSLALRCRLSVEKSQSSQCFIVGPACVWGGLLGAPASTYCLPPCWHAWEADSSPKQPSWQTLLSSNMGAGMGKGSLVPKTLEWKFDFTS